LSYNNIGNALNIQIQWSSKRIPSDQEKIIRYSNFLFLLTSYAYGRIL